MDYPMSNVPDDRDISWSDTHSTDSESSSSVAVNQSPAWTTSVTTARMNAGQLSPISTEFDIPGHDRVTGGTLPPMIHSATSSSADSWSTSWSEDIEVEDADQEPHWEHDTEGALAMPKIEPLEDDSFSMDSIKEAPRMMEREHENDDSIPPKVKRPRGRPRKHPIPQPVATSKVAKGRSKTGCITCRKRKKKCDEAKPRCMNCEKNAVVCEGYHEKQIWKSGRQRAEEEQRLRQCRPHITMQPIFQGVETPEDIVFLNHYINHVSGVLTVESQHKNAFKDMLLQMAVEHRGLMHSILSMASRHMDYDAPYCKKIIETNAKVSLESLLERSEFHHNAAMKSLYDDIEIEKKNQGNGTKVNISVRYGQMLCLLIQTVAIGSRSGEHRVHLQAYKNLVRDSPPSDSAFLVFITEFFQYRVFADELIRYPDLDGRRLATEDWVPWLPIEPSRLIGVGDGLFQYLCQITTIRNRIRINMATGIDPVVDYTSLYRAAEIDGAIRHWQPHWPPGDSRDRVGLLYKQMMWVYLYRTIYPPSMSTQGPPSLSSPRTSLSSTNSQARSSTSTSAQQAIHTPPMEPPASSQVATPPPGPPPRASSPPPIRYPPHHDYRITIAVDESLDILNSFKPSDPVQTLLLVPCLIIGCACFAPSQRDRIRTALRSVRGYTGLRNCELLAQVLEEVWRLMDLGEWARVWDWQGVAGSLGLDFSCA